MKKSSTTPCRKTARKSGKGYAGLVSAISALHTQALTRVSETANRALVLRNWMVGAHIIEFEQNGSDRARYGTGLLEKLAGDLRARGAGGLGDPRALRACRTLYRIYPQIRGSVTRELVALPLPRENSDPANEIRGSVTRELPTPLSGDDMLRFSWTQLQELIRIDDPWKRAFYENECLRGHWSVRQLQRQIETLLYERTGLSKNKKAVIERARKQAPQEHIMDMLRDPYVLEFAGLAERATYSEGELETALLDHLQHFLLELGRGFCFEARQFRITEGRKHHRVDLVFYHRVLRCHVLFDLKIRAFRPADAGQMNFYVNWFKANMMAPGDKAPIGILLCSGKDNATVEFATAGMDQKLFVSRYLPVLPNSGELKALLERDRAEMAFLMNG